MVVIVMAYMKGYDMRTNHVCLRNELLETFKELEADRLEYEAEQREYALDSARARLDYEREQIPARNALELRCAEHQLFHWS